MGYYFLLNDGTSKILLNDGTSKLLMDLPQLVTVNISESGVSIVDNGISRVALLKRTITELGNSVIDSGIVRVLLGKRTISETGISVTDSIFAFPIRIRSIIESGITIGADSISEFITRVSSIVESGVSIVDSGITRVLLGKRDISESGISITDSTSRRLSALRTITDVGISIVDSISRMVKFIRIVGSYVINSTSFPTMFGVHYGQYNGQRFTLNNEKISGTVKLGIFKIGTPDNSPIIIGAQVRKGATGSSLGTLVQQAPETYDVTSIPRYPTTNYYDFTFNTPFLNEEVVVVYYLTGSPSMGDMELIDRFQLMLIKSSVYLPLIKEEDLGIIPHHIRMNPV